MPPLSPIETCSIYGKVFTDPEWPDYTDPYSPYMNLARRSEDLPLRKAVLSHDPGGHAPLVLHDRRLQGVQQPSAHLLCERGQQFRVHQVAIGTVRETVTPARNPATTFASPIPRVLWK